MNRTSSFPYSYTPLTPIPNQYAEQSTERLYSMAECAQYLRCKPRTIGKFIEGAKGIKLEASWIGRSWLISESSLRKFVDAQKASTK